MLSYYRFNRPGSVYTATLCLWSIFPAFTLGSDICFRVEVQLQEFNNHRGIQYDGTKCDVMTPCDPMIHAAVDLENTDPGSAGSDCPLILYRRNSDNVQIDRVIVKDHCVPRLSQQPLRAQLRVKVRDYDHFSAAEPIEDFQCGFEFDLNSPINHTASTSEGWCDSMHCAGLNQPRHISLSYRWRVNRTDQVVAPLVCKLPKKLADRNDTTWDE